MSPSVISLVILGVVIAVFVWNRLPVGVVAVLTALALYATGLLSADEALAGFGDPIIIFIASLFVVSEGIDASGVTTWVGQALTGRAGGGRARLLVVVMLIGAVLTALITPNGAVAALLPMVVVVALRTALPPSQLLLPLAFAAHAGSLLVLTGSPVNVIVSDAARRCRRRRLRVLRLRRHRSATAGRHGRPRRAARSTAAAAPYVAHPPPGPRPARSHPGRALSAGRRVLSAAGARGVTPDRHVARGHGPVRVSRVSLIGAQTGAAAPTMVHAALTADDVLVVSGPSAGVSRFVVDQGLAVGMPPVTGDAGDPLISREFGVVEVVVPPRSLLVGETVFPGMRRGTDLVILAVQRRGRDCGPQPVELTEGDTLLLHGAWPEIEALFNDRTILWSTPPTWYAARRCPWVPAPSARWWCSPA